MAAKATLQLASRFKPREVNLVLSVTLKRLEGHVLIRIKPPPSNRLWIAFETVPKMELDIEPIVGSRQVIWGPVLRTIEGRIREVIAETLVLPHYDDTPFTDTLYQEFRGGIWEEPAPSEPSEEASAAERGSVDGVEKEDSGEAAQTSVDTPLGETLDKSASMPSLPQATLGMDSKKAASTIGLNGNAEGSRGPKSPGLKSSNGERKKKSSRAQSITSMVPSSPVVGTDAVNVTAVWGKDNVVDKGTATSAVMAMSRSHSSSNPNSPSTNSHPVGTPPSKLSQNSESSVEASNDQRSERSSRSSVYSQAETDELAAQADRDSVRPSTPNGSLPNSPTPSIIARTMTNASSSSSTLSSRPIRTTPEKMTVAAVGSLTTAVRNWYKARNVSGEAPADISSPGARRLPPAEIPPPPAKKTPPINVPKRKTVPPPLLPARNKPKRQVPAPPVPPRNVGTTGSDELLVVAAPDSEPTTPSSAVAEEGGSYIGGGGGEGLGSHMMFPGNESSSASASVSPGMPRRGSPSPRLEEGSSSWEPDRKRLSKRNPGEEETEQWHAAEEAELRTKVPFEPDEALT